MMRTLADTWTLAKRSLRHITRSPDTIITVLLMPIAIMLLFVYVWGGAMGQQTGSVSYIDLHRAGNRRHDGPQRHRVRRSTSQHGRAEWHHQSLQDDAGRAVVDPGRAGRVIHIVQPLLVLGGLVGGVRDRFPFAGRRDGMVGLCRDPAVAHALNDMAGHLLRPARQDDGRTWAAQSQEQAAPAHEPWGTARSLQPSPSLASVEHRPRTPSPRCGQARSNRSSIMTLSHAATKSRTNFSGASSLA